MAVVLGSLALFFTSCKSGNKSTNEHLSLRVGAMSSMDYLPYVIAEKIGVYDSLGLDLEIVKFFSANDRDAAFRAGQVDGTITDFTSAAIQHAAGLPLAIVVKHDGYFEMMANAAFTSMEELRGKKFAVARNTVIDYSTDLMLEAAGMAESDVEKPEVNKIPLRLEMMLADEVDASVFPDPFITIARAKGFTSLSSTKELDISVVGTVMRRPVLEENAEAVKLLLIGYNMGVDYILSRSLEDLKEVLVEDAGIPEALASQVVLPAYQHAVLPREKDMRATIKWLHEKELIPADYDGEGLVDGSFILE